MTTKTHLAISLLVLFVAGTPTVQGQEPASDDITLARIMADPEWLGRQPDSEVWSADGKSIFFRRQRAGSDSHSWYQIDLAGKILKVSEQDVPPPEVADNGDYDSARARRIYVRDGDLYVQVLATSPIVIQQLTRTKSVESSPQFMTDGNRVSFVRDNKVYVRNLCTGLEQLFVEALVEQDPLEAQSEKQKGNLPEQQSRIFDTIREKQRRRDAENAEEIESRRSDKTRAPRPWYLGKTDESVGQSSLSPTGKRCLVTVTAEGSNRGQRDRMPEFVHESGYVNTRDVRPLVGSGSHKSDRILLLDLERFTSRELSLESLPQIFDDPLAELKLASKPAAEVDKEPSATSAPTDGSKAESEADKPRPVHVGDIAWTDDGKLASISIFSQDNKDRWITVLDPSPDESQASDESQPISVMHRRDPAWINWRVGTVQWLRNTHSLHFISEATGHAQLYRYDADTKSTKPLSAGKFVVRNVEEGASGKYLYYQANKQHPGIYEIYRVDSDSGETTQLTHLGGGNSGVPSPDETKLLVSHDMAMSPPELWVVPLNGAGKPLQLTRTASAAFKKIRWVEPQFVEIPSRAGRPIHARLYLPPGGEKPHQPAVIFIHGAGYLQNAHKGWSPYFREFMFHSMLARRGFVVLDMDYRGSAGYGRDWRTAIYRQMGTPEVEDLLDGKTWLVDNHDVNQKRVGLYGGSYGGFLTMMALFKHPGEFGCGAALRPVTDWAHYNHGYTSNILNTPTIDPEAFLRSSPIEFAAGLADPLLICHGMVDDNVFFKDTARLAQRLIELNKENWEVAVYPIEAHGFKQPSSWRDEYRRILRLFERHLIDP
mgnify:CR=1 FL=1